MVAITGWSFDARKYDFTLHFTGITIDSAGRSRGCYPDATMPRKGNDRMRVTLKDVAMHAGVSRQAISLILGNRAHLFRPETRERVMRAVAELGYRPNAAARAISSSRTRQVGVLVVNSRRDPTTFSQTYYTIMGVNLALEEAGYVVSLVRIDDVVAELQSGSRVFREHVLDGLIVMTSIPDPVTAALERLVPVCVWADTNVWRDTGCVRRDEFQAGYLAAKAAVNAGYRRLVWWGDLPQSDVSTHFSATERYAGVLRACEEGRVELVSHYSKWDWSDVSPQTIASQFTGESAVVAYDVHRVRLAAQAAMMARKVPGEDFGLVCCEDVPELERTWPELSRVNFDRMAMGELAAEMMLSYLDAGSGKRAGVSSLLISSRYIPGLTLAGETAAGGAQSAGLADSGSVERDRPVGQASSGAGARGEGSRPAAYEADATGRGAVSDATLTVEKSASGKKNGPTKGKRSTRTDRPEAG